MLEGLVHSNEGAGQTRRRLCDKDSFLSRRRMPLRGYKQGINDDQLDYTRYCVLTNGRFHSIHTRQPDDYRNSCIFFAFFTIIASETPVLLATHLSEVFSSIVP